MRLQKLIAACFLLFTLCFVVCAQEPSATPRKVNEPTSGFIDGKVVNENGQPLAGASLFVRAVNSLGNARTTTSDLDGNFRVNGLEPALYTISGNAPAYTTVPGDPAAPVYYRIGDTVRVEMIRGGAITGTVSNALGEPVIAVRVRATLIRDARGEPPKVSSFGVNEQSTDDRGIYRIYGLRPGTYIVSAGGAGFSPSFNPYDSDLPTFAPSSTRDTAAEVTVRSGEDSTIDIRYRGEPGHIISGTAKVMGQNGASITLALAGSSIPIATMFQQVGARGFSFNGLGDGDYDLIAQEVTSNPSATLPVLALSEPKRVSIKGTDVTGIELTTRALGTISGKVLIETSKVAECQGKRPPLLAETIIRLERPEKEPDKDDLLYARMFGSSASPDTSGAFTLRNLVAGRYRFEPRFYARYWYLQSMTMTAGTAAKPQKIDAAAGWTTVKAGEQVTNLTITLAQGAASIRGRLSVPEGGAVPAMSIVLMPAEPDKADDVLRYFVSEVSGDLTFAFNNLPPGRYLASIETQPPTLAKLRQPESAPVRTKLRRAAEAKKTEIELKPCQNLVDYQFKQ
ncbi:MAG TPA: carboxypeptidase-like regulatory domain-containing protein [Pyrinomonadaceae bacterium]|nr:carboxypeptidase-like regulatory domain-containing protein [Pyrinomonadaceae bacterium]